MNKGNTYGGGSATPRPKRQAQRLLNILRPLPTTIQMTHSNQILHNNQKTKFFTWSIMPMAVSKFFLIQTLTCDLFEVATFLLLRHLIQTDTEPNYRLLWFSDEQWYLKHR